MMVLARGGSRGVAVGGGAVRGAAAEAAPEGPLDALGGVVRDERAQVREAVGDDVDGRLDDGPPDQVDRGHGLVREGGGAEEDLGADDGGYYSAGGQMDVVRTCGGG